MPILQVNIWICENCGITSTTTEETSQYSDPVIMPPKGEVWDYIVKNEKELFVCGECFEKHNKTLLLL